MNTIIIKLIIIKRLVPSWVYLFVCTLVPDGSCKEVPGLSMFNITITSTFCVPIPTERVKE